MRKATEQGWGLMREEYQTFNLKMSIRHPRGDDEYTTRYVSVESGRRFELEISMWELSIHKG